MGEAVAYERVEVIFVEHETFLLDQIFQKLNVFSLEEEGDKEAAEWVIIVEFVSNHDLSVDEGLSETESFNQVGKACKTLVLDSQEDWVKLRNGDGLISSEVEDSFIVFHKGEVQVGNSWSTRLFNQGS